MTAYNKLNGTHCYANKHLLDDILRKEWGYEGTVISDWGGVHDTKMAAEAALDIEMSVTDNFEEYYLAQPLKKAIQEGEIKEEQLDEKVIHILMLMMRMHIIEGAQENRPRKSGTYNTEEHRRETLQVARESVVLLKNEKQRLPLHPEKTKKLLVIGENAECVHSNGGGSAEIKALYEITPLMGIKTLLGGNAEVRFIKGYCRDGKVEKSDVNWQEASLENGGGSTKTGIASVDAALKAKRKSLRREAVELAAQYEDVILIGGLNHDCDSEGNDRADMKLPYEQDLLIKEVLKANPNTIIVMMGGSPVEMHKWINQAQAVVWNWYSGMEGGRALAEVLFGKVNPSGKLPETFYVRHTDCSAHAVGEFPGGEAVHYTEGVFVGYRYNDTFHISPQFCFGHGLSYTTFAYSNPSVRWQNGCCIVTLEVENIGELDGKETVQVYAAPVKRLEDEPVQQLKGFEKVTLAAGEKKNAEIVVEVPEEKRVRLRIGSSSRDIRLEMEV